MLVPIALLIWAEVACRTRYDHLAPWNKLPGDAGITYLETYSRVAGMDPMFLALVRYQGDEDLARILETFELVPYEGDGEFPRGSWAGVGDEPDWFPLEGATERYHFWADGRRTMAYVVNAWVDPDRRLLLLERTWW